MIRVARFTMNDTGEDSITDHECATVKDAVALFDQSATSMIVRCDNDRDYLGILFGMRKANDPIVEADAAKAAPGEKFQTRVWEFKGQLTDGPGWRLIYGRDPKVFQKPAAEEPKLELVTDPQERAAAIKQMEKKP
jgi:hypothetical protein